ncbi:DUF4157 domain-containing protein [Cyanobacteria bacterium FACHB-471]|nr:DUF4157 domain-containing protein [Cyanobacteria bacterium FACHB-471]
MSRINFDSDRPASEQHRPLPIQPKLTVGAPNDQYEQEADRVAAQVMSMPDTAIQQSIQREVMPEEEELQTKPIAASITPLVQRETIPEEEELQTKSLGNSSIQREEIPEEEEVQMKAAPSIQREEMPEEEEVQTKAIANTLQREELPEEEEIQTKSLSNSLQREEMPDEEEVQTKPALQRSSDGSLQAGSSIESRLNSSKGGGSPLPDEVRSFMEPRFGIKLDHVRVHTDSAAIQMNRDLNAQAFTHQQDVYFGVGKAPGKDALTAHELTHVVQQKDSQAKVDRKLITPGQERTERDWYEGDMNHWASEIGSLSNTKNTFVQSAIYNTKNNFPDEYVSIAQRSAYYDVIDALAVEGVLPKKIRFFGAAAKVTGRNSVGSIEGLIGWSLHSKEAIQILKDINKILFESNMKIINRLMGGKGKPADPRSPDSTEAISAMQFDLNMVEVEQNIVESYLKEKTGKISAEVLKDINDDLNFKGFWRTLGEYTFADTQPLEWAKKFLGKDKLDFMEVTDRVAIGKALVFSLHSNTFDEYSLYMGTGVMPIDRLREDYRTPFSMSVSPK